MKKLTSIEKAKNLHQQFPWEVQEFLNYMKLYIKYGGKHDLLKDINSDKKDKISVACKSRLLKLLNKYQELLDHDGLAFAYMLFQPSSVGFVENCILSFSIHAENNDHFKKTVNAYYA